MRTEIIPYKKTAGFETGEKKVLGINISRSLLLLPVAFLLGRVMFPSGIMPLGLALFVAASFTDVNKILLALFTLSGMVCGGAKEQIYITAASMLITSAVLPILKKMKKTGMFAVSAAAAGSILVPGMLFVYLQGFLVYDILKEIFDSVLVFSFVFIFKNPVSLISEGRKIKAYSSEEITGAVILAILTLSGFGDLNIIGFSLKNIISILIIMLLSYKCGPGIGASAGVTVGITAGLSGSFNPLIFGTYAFCGLLSGTFRKLGKVGACLGFVIGNAMLTVYLTGSSEILVHLKEITAAAAIFLLIPASLLDAFTGRFETTADIELDKPGYSKRIKELTVDRLTRFSNAFRELSRTFTEISETRVIAGKQDISVLFDQVADRVCRDCSLCLHCWERNFYNTYQVMFKIVERLDEKGRIDQADIPEYFIERCERIY
ncbi:MAG TPA: stage II sporulation protein E, partial [Clostridia bacterium]